MQYSGQSSIVTWIHRYLHNGDNIRTSHHVIHSRTRPSVQRTCLLRCSFIMSLSDISGGSELSSRHIPDIDTLSNISNTSFSFQIPGTEAGPNLLADEDVNDFFQNAGGVDISLALTHAPPFSPVHMSPAPCRNGTKDADDPTFGFHDARSSTPQNIADPPFRPALDDLGQRTKSPNQRPKLNLKIGPAIQTIPPSPMTSVPRFTHQPSVSTANDLAECNLSPVELKPTETQDSVQLPDHSDTNTKKNSKIKAEELGVQKNRLLRPQKVGMVHLLNISILIIFICEENRRGWHSKVSGRYQQEITSSAFACWSFFRCSS